MNNSTKLRHLSHSKWKHRNQRSNNYFYRVFDNIASQLAVINQGLKDSGPKRVWEIK